ncbi:MAG: hypothetical protein IIC55_10710, partial [Proteobacteria bacterium]|nr:hypothetical protein [Pseudomonadota bacterium]
MGDAVPNGGSLNLAGARLVDESWESITVDGAEQIALRVLFETDALERIELQIRLDPESQLPS